MATRHLRGGFTLIELLVVIAIISILASIMMPVFSQARGKGRQAACIANVKQVCLALAMYAQDYDEVYPRGQAAAGDPETQWYNAIFPYTRNRQIMYCPDRKDKAPGYALNWRASGVSMNSFWDPAMKITVMDIRPEAIGAASPWHVGADGDWHCNDAGNDICNAPSDNSFTGNNWPQLHNDGVIIGFADSHVKWAREQNVDTAVYWDPAIPSE